MFRPYLTLTLTLLLTGALPALQAQGAGEIQGTVVDPGGDFVRRVRVEVSPSRQVIYTDNLGRFEIKGLAPGRYTLSASNDDFEPVTGEPVEVSAERPATVELRFEKVRASQAQMNVIGGDAEVALREIPGSVFLISREEIAERRPMDANEVLRTVPGVHIREDSGPVGMRLNIGIRGLNPDRSRSLLVLEDGLPLSLAPYGEPEMYYSPPIDRMSRIEILKGSGSIVHGPQTIGGVLNFVTPDPPSQPQGTLDLIGGQRGFFTGQASYGGTNGNVGWFINGLRKQGDGWRDFFFDINDITSKFNVAISDVQRVTLKFGVYDERSNSTYLGLTDSQFRTNPNLNVVPDDLLKVKRYSGALMHQYVLSPRALLSSSVFGYSTIRNWRRQDFDRSPAAGRRYLAVHGDPTIPGDALYMRDSTGNRNREFDVAGAETRLSLEHNGLGIRQRLETGVRYVYEQHRDRHIDGSHYLALSGVIREDEMRTGGASSGFIQNRMYITDRLTITPGLRIENYDYTRNIFRQRVGGVPTDVNVRNGDNVLKPIPGLGVSFQAAAPLTLFGGVHRGFAPPRVKDAITRSGDSLLLDAELSWNYEAGARVQVGRGVRAEATFFATDFQNQIIPATQSGGAVTTLINGGETMHRGTELLLALDWARLLSNSFGLYTEFRHTYIRTAEFTNGIFRGNRLPYAPEQSLGIRTGYRHRRGFAVHIDGTRVGDQFGDNRQTVQGSADGTIGLIPSYWVWNLTAGHEIQRERYGVSPFVTIKNLADARYISSRAPQGIQPGMFRQLNAGVRFRF